MRFHFCEDNQMASTDTTSALTSIINILTPLTSEDRHRTVNAAMLFLGETVKAPGPAGTGKGVGEGSNPGAVGAWMTQYGVSQDQMDQVFHFNNDGSFSIHDAPGRSKKEKTLNTYILTGLGKFLMTNDRAFDNSMARGFCETIGCVDPGNHAAYLKNKGPEFSGDKNKGYSLTNVGVKRGAALVKELASAAK